MPVLFEDTKDVPCVMFLHTRGGCRVEGMFLRQYFLPKVAYCVFDFAGSGLSEGDYISLGPKEKRDAKKIIDHIKKAFSIGPIFLWGRSMGAITSILLARDHPEDVAGLILDAPFSEISTMVLFCNLGKRLSDIIQRSSSVFDWLCVGMPDENC